MKFEQIYKKRFFKPVIQLAKHNGTFTAITKSKLQYTHPNIITKLPFNPTRIISYKNAIYCITNKRIYTNAIKENEDNDRQNEDGKFYKINMAEHIRDIGISNDRLILFSKKVLFLDKGLVSKQLYGPECLITSFDTIENYILAISENIKEVYLFKTSNHLKYEVDSRPTQCAFLDDENFVVGCSDGKLYYFNIDKKRSIEFIDMGSYITVIKHYEEYLFIGTNNKILIVKEKEIYDQILVDGIVNDILILDNTVIVATGTEPRDGRINVEKNAKNSIIIYNIKK